MKLLTSEKEVYDRGMQIELLNQIVNGPSNIVGEEEPNGQRSEILSQNLLILKDFFKLGKLRLRGYNNGNLQTGQRIVELEMSRPHCQNIIHEFEQRIEEGFDEENTDSEYYPFSQASPLIQKLERLGIFEFIQGQSATIIGDCKFCAIQNPIFKIKMHFAVVFCLFTYEFFTEINSNHSQADFFWLTKSCKSFYYRLQENNNRSKCFDFECIKRVEQEYRANIHSALQLQRLQQEIQGSFSQTKIEFQIELIKEAVNKSQNDE